MIAAASEFRQLRALPPAFCPKVAVGIAAVAIALVAAQLLFATAAKSAADEATQEAQALLDKTLHRAEFGEVTPGDVALARYNLLEMRLTAGQLSSDAFCRAAEPELKAVAADVDDDPAGQKKQWLDAVTGMSESTAKCRAAAAATAGLLFDVKAVRYSGDAVRQAEAALAAVQTRAAQGEAMPLDVLRARLAVLQAQYGANQVSRAAFCHDAVAQARELVKAVVDAEAVGQTWLGDEIAARRKVYDVEARCAG